MQKKFLVLGCGSIGRRHLHNLKTLGVENLMVYDPNFEKMAQSHNDTGAEMFDNLAAAFNSGPDVCFICSPTSVHVEQSIQAAQHNCHLFIEKPLSHNFSDLDRLKTEVESRNLITLVGCNMRFHPGPVKVKELLSKNSIGRVLFSHLYFGSFLPDWRPATNYKETYSAKLSLGGGALLDCIHEIDLACWYLGNVREVFCLIEKLLLDIETEDAAFLTLRHSNNIISHVHLDYLQRTYQRGCKIVGEEGTIFWDFNSKQVTLYQARENNWQIFSEPDNWQINQMYVDEIQYFLDCLKRGKNSVYPVSDAVQTLRVALAAKKSADSKTFVALNEE